MILITGANGFIGSHLTHYLNSKKFRIIGLSNKLENNLNIRMIKKNIESSKPIEIPKDVSTIIHLAAMSDLQKCKKFPKKCFQINVLGTQNVLECARKNDCSVIFASTSHVYGNPIKLPINENHPRNPTSIYASTKNAAEHICQAYAHSYGLNISIIRVFSVYGPKSPPHLVTTQILTQLKKNKDLELGNLSAKRDFIYVKDVISAIEIILKKSKKFNVFNVGSEKSYSIHDLCKVLEKISKREIRIKSKKSLIRKNDVPEVISDCKRLKKLGWKPKTDINKGLKYSYNWFLQNN